MKNKIILLSIFLLIPTISFAEQVTITVKGMVCSFCAQGIKKTFGKMEDVKTVNVDLEKKFVKLELKDGSKLTNEAIEVGIKDAGYDVEKIERQ